MGEAFKRIFKGYMISVIIFFALTVIFAFLLRFTPFPERWTFEYLIMAFSVSGFFVGLYTAGHFQKRGLVYGMVLSALFMVGIITMINGAFRKVLDFSDLNWKYIIPVTFGGIGGIIGANAKK